MAVVGAMWTRSARTAAGGVAASWVSVGASCGLGVDAEGAESFAEAGCGQRSPR